MTRKRTARRGDTWRAFGIHGSGAGRRRAGAFRAGAGHRYRRGETRLQGLTERRRAAQKRRSPAASRPNLARAGAHRYGGGSHTEHITDKGEKQGRNAGAGRIRGADLPDGAGAGYQSGGLADLPGRSWPEFSGPGPGTDAAAKKRAYRGLQNAGAGGIHAEQIKSKFRLVIQKCIFMGRSSGQPPKGGEHRNREKESPTAGQKAKPGRGSGDKNC